MGVLRQYTTAALTTLDPPPIWAPCASAEGQHSRGHGNDAYSAEWANSAEVAAVLKTKLAEELNVHDYRLYASSVRRFCGDLAEHGTAGCPRSTAPRSSAADNRAAAKNCRAAIHPSAGYPHTPPVIDLCRKSERTNAAADSYM